jgi:hypothetical protein
MVIVRIGRFLNRKVACRDGANHERGGISPPYDRLPVIDV